MKTNRHWLLAVAGLLAFSLAVSDEVRELSWQDLLPEGAAVQQPVVPDHSGQFSDPMGGDDALGDPFEDDFGGMPMLPSSQAEVVAELDKTAVKIPGFVVPLEVADEGKVSEFLLVPYFGACIHYPPPPRNQIVYVKLDKPRTIDSIWDPVWVYGEMRTEGMTTELGSAGYTLIGEDIEAYDY